MKFRVYLGALISLLDMYTDIETILRFFNEGNNGFAWANVSFVITSLVIQIVVAYAQHRKRGAKLLAYEFSIVLSLLKPAIDARRVWKCPGRGYSL